MFAGSFGIKKTEYLLWKFSCLNLSTVVSEYKQYNSFENFLTAVGLEPGPQMRFLQFAKNSTRYAHKATTVLLTTLKLFSLIILNRKLRFLQLISLIFKSSRKRKSLIIFKNNYIIFASKFSRFSND